MKLMLIIALYGVLVGLLATEPRADDIDIYRGSVGAGQAPARIMLALDLRSEGADVVCADAASVLCQSLLGAELYAELDLFGLTVGHGGRFIALRSADGLPDIGQADAENIAKSMASVRWPTVPVDRYDVLRAALRVVLKNVGAGLHNTGQQNQVLVGLMATHADDCAGAGPRYSPDFAAKPARGCSQGAYVLKGLVDISQPLELEELLLALAALPDPGRRAPWMASEWPGHPYKIRDIYLELYRYLTGQAVFNGFLGTRDYGSGFSGNLYHPRHGAVTNDVLLTLPDGMTDQPLLAPATDSLLPSSVDLATDNVAGARYRSPLAPNEACSRVAMVNFQFGAASDSHRDTDTAIAAPLASGGLGLSLAAGVAGDRALVAWLAGVGRDEQQLALASGISIKSYFFARDTNATSETMAAAGGAGRAFSMADPAGMVAALESIFSEVSGGSRTLVAASTLANDSGQTRYASDIYFTLFQPQAGPLWAGNIKKLKVVGPQQPQTDSAVPVNFGLIAQAPLTRPARPAISIDDGLILPDALTFWTDPNGADVLAFDPGLDEVMGRDGRSVTRGGAGQQIPGFLADSVGSGNGEPGARQVFTLNPAVPGELLALDAIPSTVSAIELFLDPGGAKNEQEKLDLLRWIRGQDSFDADGDGDRSDSRAWLLADPLHSRPLAVSYGARSGSSYSLANPDVRLFFGTNDGFFHIVRNTLASGEDSGQESWAFMPPQMLGMQSQLAQNRVNGTAHPYGLDGEAVALIRDTGRDGSINAEEGDLVWVFIGQRRGGNAIHAFDMTDPDRPRFMWVIDNHSAGFDQLALTFSTPRIAHLDLGHSAPTAVLLFAGGYHGGWAGGDRIGKDAGNEADPVGNAIYVVNPADGSLIWRAVGPGAASGSTQDALYVGSLLDSIPSPVSVIDSDHNGVDDRGYFGDSGGTVWRIDFTEAPYRQKGSGVTDASNWYLSKVAVLGGSGDADRRFFHAPDVVQSADSSGDYAGVVLVSGNRAAPGDVSVRDFAYLLKDRRPAGVPFGSGGASTRHEKLQDISQGCDSRGGSPCSAADLVTGWKLELQSQGEKGLSVPLVTNGKVVFTSYLPYSEPLADPCLVTEGHGRVYAVNLSDGSAALPVAGKLTLEEEELVRHMDIGPGLPGDVVPYQDQVLIPGLALEDALLISGPSEMHWRVYWREDGVDEL